MIGLDQSKFRASAIVLRSAYPISESSRCGAHPAQAAWRKLHRSTLPTGECPISAVCCKIVEGDLVLPHKENRTIESLDSTTRSRSVAW